MPFYPSLLLGYYNYRKGVDGLNDWQTPNLSYNSFITDLNTYYDGGYIYEKFYMDYFTRYFEEGITGTTSGTSGGGTYVTGGTANESNSTLTFMNSTGTSFTVANSALLFNDAYVSGGTLNPVTGVVTFINTSGGTFPVSGFSGFTSYWSANTNGSITNSGNTDITTTGNITTGIFNSTGKQYKLNGDKALYIESTHIYVGHDDHNTYIEGKAINLQTATTINANLTVTGNTNISGSTTYIGAISGTGSVTALGGFVGDVTGNASTSTKIATIDNNDIVVLTGAQTLTGTKTLNSFKGTGSVTVTDIKDTDNFSDATATSLATSESIKEYVLSQVATSDSLQEVTDIGATTNNSISTAGLVSSGIVDITNSTEATDATGDTGALRTEGGASIAKKLYLGGDLNMVNGKQLFLGNGSESDPAITFLSDTDTGIRLASIGQMRFVLAGADYVTLNSGGFFPNSDSALQLGLTGYRWSHVYTDALTSTGQITGTEIEGTSLDINGAGDVSGNLTTAGLVSSGIVDITNVTDSTDATGDTGALRTEGGASIAKKLFVGDIPAAGGGYTGNKILVSDGGGIEYLTTAELKADIADADYWSANTDGSISTSGVTNVKISGNTEMAGTLNVTGTITGNLTGEVTGNPNVNK